MQVKKLETRPRRRRGRAWARTNALSIIFYIDRGYGPPHVNVGGKLFCVLMGLLLLLFGMISWMTNWCRVYEYIRDFTGAIRTHGLLYITVSSNTITHTIHLIGTCSWGHFEMWLFNLDF